MPKFPTPCLPYPPPTPHNSTDAEPEVTFNPREIMVGRSRYYLVAVEILVRRNTSACSRVLSIFTYSCGEGRVKERAVWKWMDCGAKEREKERKRARKDPSTVDAPEFFASNVHEYTL